LVILDEIHKYRQWKNYLKSVYEKFHDRYAFAVLGSGRLDIGKRAGGCDDRPISGDASFSVHDCGIVPFQGGHQAVPHGIFSASRWLAALP
jgi:hypothetical protein